MLSIINQLKNKLNKDIFYLILEFLDAKEIILKNNEIDIIYLNKTLYKSYSNNLLDSEKWIYSTIISNNLFYELILSKYYLKYYLNFDDFFIFWNLEKEEKLEFLKKNMYNDHLYILEEFNVSEKKEYCTKTLQHLLIKNKNKFINYLDCLNYSKYLKFLDKLIKII